MLPHRPRQPRRDDLGLGMDVKSARASTSSVSVDAVYSGNRLRTRAERAHLSRVALPIPLLLGTSRSMTSVPTKRSLASADESIRPVPVDTAGLGSRKTRLFAAMRRSNSYKSEKGLSGKGMFSTPEERSAAVSLPASRSTSPARTTQPPSISQIAMGLHTSRTPHLGPTHTHLVSSEPVGARSAAAHAHSHGRGRASLSPPPSSHPQTASSSTRVTTPLRSSLKKADASRSTSPSASATSVMSTSRSTLSRISLAITKGTGRSRLDKFLGRGMKSPTDSITSLNSSEGDLGTPRKAVRFVSIAEGKVAPALGDPIRRSPHR